MLGPRLRSNITRAWLVHIYTASGALAAFFGTVAVFEARYRDSLLFMMFATCVDATDGVLARQARSRGDSHQSPKHTSDPPRHGSEG